MVCDLDCQIGMISPAVEVDKRNRITNYVAAPRCRMH